MTNKKTKKNKLSDILNFISNSDSSVNIKGLSTISELQKFFMNGKMSWIYSSGFWMVWISNRIWKPEAQLFEIQTNGRHFVKNHLKSGQKRQDFEWSGFQMVGTIAIAQPTFLTLVLFFRNKISKLQ